MSAKPLDPWAEVGLGHYPPSVPDSAARTDRGRQGRFETLRDGSGVGVLGRAEAWFRAYVRTRSEHGPLVLALWAAHTHALDYLYSTPRLVLTSALPECGKTTVLEHLERLCAEPLMGSNATPSLIARAVAGGVRTVLLDEADILLNAKREGTPDLIATVNSGYRRGGTRPVNVPTKDGGWRCEKMPTYAAVSLAGIGTGDTLPENISSRSITLDLDRALDGEVTRTEWRDLEDPAAQMAADLATEVETRADDIERLRPPLPPGVYGRNRECWEPLVVIAQVLGGDELADRTRAACADLIAETNEAKREGWTRTSSYEVLLLDVAEAFWEGEDFVPTDRLLYRLTGLPDRWYRDELTPKRLAGQLRRLGIKPSKDRETRTKRGYRRSDVMAQRSRYERTQETPREVKCPAPSPGVPDVPDPSTTEALFPLSETESLHDD
jgi:hypothetical protein